MIEYLHRADGVEATQLKGFFEVWPRSPTPETHLRILRAADEVVLARPAETGPIVGFATAISMVCCPPTFLFSRLCPSSGVRASVASSCDASWNVWMGCTWSISSANPTSCPSTRPWE